jgi:SAM-dependent methyltransferase
MLFAEERLAALYDRIHPPQARTDVGFYLAQVRSARAVLDVGCGTGVLLHLARRAGHSGRLCGLDPAGGMLAQARRRTDIEWVRGDLGTVRFDQEFDLVVMTGHVFQVFTDDDQLRQALAGVRSALTSDGRFVFETRNPAARAWQHWNPDEVTEVTDADGATVRVWHEARPPGAGDLVRFATMFASPDWPEPRISHSTLRFLPADAVTAFLTEADLTIAEQYGDWDTSPLSATSPEIITVARSC